MLAVLLVLILLVCYLERYSLKNSLLWGVVFSFFVCFHGMWGYRVSRVFDP